ncbi:MAG: TIGR03087 family PEP-CTERM/XrtA system glycosyltransferase [Pirellulaceae bacterium]
MLAPRPKILFLSHRLPFPPNRGDRIRAYHTIEFLSKFLDVYLGSLADEPWDPSQIAHLEKLCKEVRVCKLDPRRRWLHACHQFALGEPVTQGAFYSRELAQQVKHWTSQPLDAALIFCSSMGQYANHFKVRPRKIVVDLVDVDSQKWSDYAQKASIPKKWLYRTESRRIDRLEKVLADTADSSLVVSQDEARLYSARHPGLVAHAIGNGVDHQFFSPECGIAPAAQSSVPGIPKLVFVGVLDYLPNSQGIQWFCRDILPVVRQSLPGVQLSIVGRNPPAEVLALGQLQGVQVVGPVRDVRPYVLAADIAIAPLQIARGVQNKVLEALACGKPVIATPEAATGIEGVEGIRVADRPLDWLTAIQELTDPEIYASVSKAAREQIVKNYSWDAQLAPLLSLLGVGP